jgi:hypothetical protein
VADDYLTVPDFLRRQDNLVAELRTEIGRLNDQLAERDRQLAEAQDLLRRAWEFPDRPTPEEDEMRTHAEFAAEQEAWRAKREAMDAAVKRALAAPEAGV